MWPFTKSRLVWKKGEFNEFEAVDEPYRYVVWSGNGITELRLIQREQFNGIGMPFQDFSIYTRDINAAFALAEEVNKLIRKARRYK
jgi:hypothetical protein